MSECGGSSGRYRWLFIVGGPGPEDGEGLAPGPGDAAAGWVFSVSTLFFQRARGFDAGPAAPGRRVLPLSLVIDSCGLFGLVWGAGPFGCTGNGAALLRRFLCRPDNDRKPCGPVALL